MVVRQRARAFADCPSTMEVSEATIVSLTTLAAQRSFGRTRCSMSPCNLCDHGPSDCTKSRRLGSVASVATSPHVGLDSRAACHRGIRAAKARRTVLAASGPTEFTSPYQGSAAFFNQGGSSSHSALGIR